MHRKFDVRRHLTAVFVGIFAVVGAIVAVDAPANAVAGDSSTVDYTGTFNYTTGPASGSVSPIASNDTTFTVEAWVNPAEWASTHDYMVIFGQGLPTLGCVANRYGLFLSNTVNSGWKIHIAHNDCGLFSPVLVPNNSWTHIAEVVNGSSVTIYINGAAAWTTTYNWSASFGTGSVIGSAVDGSDSFKGSIDQVKIWNSNLSQSQIQTSMHTFGAGGISGLSAHFDFNEDSGNTVYNRANTSQYLTGAAVTRADVKTTNLNSGRTVVKFPRTYLPGIGGWRVPTGVTRLDALAVAGGGGGGSRHGGGGGAGELGSYSGFVATPGSDLTIKVGMGGAGFDSTSNNTSSTGGSGQSTVFGADEFLGGGGGQAGTGPVKNGGSGGGTAGTATAGLAVNGTGTTASPVLTRFASAGGSGNNNGGSWWGGGGGGGATGAGIAATTSAAGNGGQGFSSSISGTAACYAAGGGGASSNSSVGAAGTCTNGATSTATAGSYDDVMGAATPNSGSGGGAGGLAGDDKPSDSGASGVVILSYATSLDDNAWDFAGSADNKYVATNKQLIPSKASFTFEGWAKADSLSANSWNDIFRQQATTSNYKAFEVAVYSRRLQVISSIQDLDANTYNTYVASDSRTLFNTGQWYHIAVASEFLLSGSNTINNFKVYLDGFEVYSATRTILTTSLSVLGSAQLSIGGLYSATNRGWDGQLDQFKVWNGALTQSEIQKSMHTYDATGVVSTSGSSLRALYDFNSASTSTLVDQTGNGYDFAPTAGAAAPTVRNVRDTATSGSTTAYSFTRSYLNTWGGWIPENTSASASVIAVGGGGGGAENVGAGGSGGGISYSTGKSISPVSVLPIQVGQGGAGGSYYLNNASDSTTASQLRDGSNGQDSKVGFATAMVGSGGIGGQTYWLDNKCGGAGNNNVDTVGIAGTGGSTNSAGGTGGKGAAGSGNGFAGGAGYTTSIRGASETFAGGGGGGSFGAVGASGGVGGSGGGGAGASASGAAGTAATANTGGGGGGGSVQCGAGANGGSGIVVVAVFTGAGNPTISSHPANITKSVGQTANFNVTAASPDSGTLSYQWQVSTDSGSNWSNVSGGSGATTNSYTTATLASGDQGKQYRVQVTNTLSGTSATSASTAATLTIGLDAVNVQFDELDFDFSDVAHVVGTNGKSVGNKVLFRNVTTKGGVQVDALVTTETLSGATIANYESGAGAGGANSYFQADVDISAANGYAEFKFDFYVHGSGDPCASNNTTCSGATKVKLQNVNVSAIDIDYNQWNDFTAVESYTLAGNSQTKLKECPIPGSGTCTVSTAPGSFPANMRFQGSADTARTNDPVDMAIVSYAEIETFKIKFGRSAIGKPNYYGVAFKALSWGSQTPSTSGGTTYTVSYDKNGASGNAPTSSTGVVGSNVTLPGVGSMTRTGYTFAGWNTLADGTGTTYAAANVIQMPQGGTTLYAMWSAVQYMLTYKLYGGLNGPATEMRATASVANLSSTQPTRSGVVFSSWNTAADGTGTNYAPGASFTMPGANTTLHAMYTVATGTISYNANNGSGAPSSSTGTSGTSTTAAAVGSMTRTNYTFSGWNTAANGSGTDYIAGASITYPANGVTTTLYAQWTPVLYSYSYNANGGSGAPAGGSATAGTTVNISATTPTRTGYTFAGWTTAADGTGTVYSNGGANPSISMPGSNTTFYAKWTAINYTLTYNANGGSGAPAASTGNSYGSQVVVASAPTAPAGQKFNGWNTVQGGTGATYAAGANYQITADATLYAQWVVDTVNLFYNANGGSGAPTSLTATANQNTPLSATTPTRTGFNFSGWTTASNGTGTVYGASSQFPVPGTDTTLYAKWTPIGYNFIYDANGGTGAPSTVAYFMGDFVTIDNSGTTVRTGYTFAGWNTMADGTGSDYIGGQQFLMSNSNMTMYAKWTSNPYTLTYNANGGQGAPTAETRNAGSVANLSSTTPTRSGYTFNGWNLAANGSGQNYNAGASFTMSTSNATLFAQWAVNSNALSYNANAGSGAPTGATYNFGATVTVSNTTPTRTGYTFLGWNTAANGSGSNYAAADTFAMPNSSVILYAQWSAVVKTMTYDANGGAGVDAVASYSFGATVTVSATQPTRAGYSFIGWNSMADATGTTFAAGSTFSMPANDVTAYAIWSVNAYTVYYNMNGGVGTVTPQPGTFGSTVTVSATVPTRTGYTFSGWNTLADGTGSDYTGGGSLTIPSSNVTLFAKWTAVQYTISYNANSGSGAPSDATGLTAASNVTLSSTTPVRTGYIFNGWNTAANGSAATYAAGQAYVVPAANTVLYAQWVADTYQIIYNANGGTGAPAAATGTTNSTISLSASTPTRAGYTFTRWNSDVTDANSGTRYSAGGSFTVPAGNTVLYAIWSLADITLTYDVNGGSGTTPSGITDKYLASVTLAASTSFTRSGYTFNGWNTAADGSGTSYSAESNYVLPASNVTLFAQWSQVFYAIEYNANGGSGEPADQFATPGQNISLSATEPTKSGYDFEHWTLANQGTTVTPGGSITMPSNNVILVANWVTRSSVSAGGNQSSPSASPSPSPAAKKLNATVYFKGDSAVLQPAAKAILKKLAIKAKANGKASKIQVIGRVKETPDKSYDMRLSRQRATNVTKYLKSFGVTGVYVITAAGISPENKPISRRVDMYLYWSN